jgi:hypothetical protein
MTITDHQDLIEELLGLVRAQLADGHMDFTVIVDHEGGGRGIIKIDPRYLEDEESKDMLRARLRRVFRQRGVFRYALVAECWIDRNPPAPRVPIDCDDPAEYVAQYHEEYERRGYSPSEGGGRDEIIFMHVCDRKHSTCRIWTIKRDAESDQVRDLIPFEIPADDQFLMFGRFVNLLSSKAH